MTAYGKLCTEFYDLDKPVAPADALAFYINQARVTGGRILEPMCGSGRFLLPMVQSGLLVEGVDSSNAMLDACQNRARDLGLEVTLYQQDLESIELPHRYTMAFVPSGSIGLVTTDAGIRRVFSGLRSSLQPNGTLLLEVTDKEHFDDGPTEYNPRTVTCQDGSTITYQCYASRPSGAILFSGTYLKRRGETLIETETEELLLREYDVDEIAEALISCGFRNLKLLRSSELAFLINSGCTLIDARADA